MKNIKYVPALAIMLMTVAASAQTAPAPPPFNPPSPDLADQLVRITAQANAVLQEKNKIEQDFINDAAEIGSLQAKLATALAAQRAAEKDRDALKHQLAAAQAEAVPTRPPDAAPPSTSAAPATE